MKQQSSLIVHIAFISSQASPEMWLEFVSVHARTMDRAETSETKLPHTLEISVTCKLEPPTP